MPSRPPKCEMFVGALDPIPLADEDEDVEDRRESQSPVTTPSDHARGFEQPRWRPGKIIPGGVIAALCLAHGVGIWLGLGGWAGLTNGWPLWRDDHPLYYHSAVVTREFLRASGTTAGYDPSFMSGYAKSVIFPASSTLPEMVVWAFGGEHPEFAYKMYVLFSAAAVPWLIGLACVAWRIPPLGTAIAILLDLLYIWTDFPINYAAFGMLPYFVAIPLGLVATGTFARYLTTGGTLNWLVSTTLLSLAFLVHLTVAMVLGPAALFAYLAAARRRRSDGANPTRSHETASIAGPVPPRGLTLGVHIAVWLIPVVVLAVNAFWWLPGIWLASTKGPSDFAFAHPEGVLRRLFQIVNMEAPIQSVLLAIGIPGLFLLVRRAGARGWALVGFCVAGLAWGYLAGGFRALDFLQPGRHTYALFTGLAVAGGICIDELSRRLRVGPNGVDHLDRWVIAGMVLVGLRVLGYPLVDSVRVRLIGGEPFLSSRPSPRLLWVVDRVKTHVARGERLLYEEGGFDIPGTRDPFQRGRFSGLLPERTGVEVIGGPYLHASLRTNFTQFGEGKLFGRMHWDRDYFSRYATLYRPAAIVCWSPWARQFCRDQPDLIRILEDDGTVLIGRVNGFSGDVINGEAEVEATADRIRVRGMSPGLDGSIVLRYHSVPYLRTSPEVACEPEYREDDPVPFIRLRPSPGIREVELKLRIPGWR